MGLNKPISGFKKPVPAFNNPYWTGFKKLQIIYESAGVKYWYTPGFLNPKSGLLHSLSKSREKAFINSGFGLKEAGKAHIEFCIKFNIDSSLQKLKQKTYIDSYNTI